jgi:Uma2 family endonuclease
MSRMDLPAQKHRYTITEYLELERRSVDRHEYCDGEILLMAGGSVEHARIASNLIRELGIRLKGTRCEAFGSDLRVRTSGSVLYAYPDVTVVCGGPQFEPDDPRRDTITNPRMIVEVLSPSTESFDRVRKFDRYGQVQTLEEYVLVSQDEPRVEAYWRREHGAWLFLPASGLSAVAKFGSIKVDLPLGEIYSGVAFPAKPEEG